MLTEALHGIVVSVGYGGDYLDVSLSHNRPMLDHCVVVTSPEDKDSQRIAGKHNCQLVITEDGNKDPGFTDNLPEEFGVRDAPKLTRYFNKGAMIERGLQQLPQNGYRIHWDADIVFPGNMRERLGTALYDRTAIYGCDRMNVIGWDAWQKLLASGWATKGFEHHHFLTYSINKMEIGSRLIYGDQGWLPLGFWTCWHGSSEYSGIYRTKTYPKGSNNAAHSDCQWALLRDRTKRIFVPEIIVAHLMTDDMSYGKNWNGRVTKKFGPPIPQKPDNSGKNKSASTSC